ncbi:MAG: nickel pincer cofactor biosynthesis protein LarB [Candidatus Bathyarchaeia archaeon]
MREVLEKLARGEISVQKAEELIKVLTIEEVGNWAKIDLGRDLRKGFPEIILAEGKSLEDLVEMAGRILKEKGRVIVSRASQLQVEALMDVLSKDRSTQLYSKAGMVVAKQMGYEVEKTGGRIGILTGGTTDIPVAEEARIVSEEMGCEVVIAYDVGAAGIHRTFQALKEMVARDVDVIIAVAGREGALPTIVAGMVDVPVIAVPCSTGYGLGKGGVSALMAMLQSCSLGLAVVNIDGGVAAGAVATLIANRVAKFRGKSNIGKKRPNTNVVG